MNDFTASNGVTVANHGGNWDQNTIHFTGEVLGLTKERTNARDVVFEDRDFEALREFFQAEADERLGRWRDLEDDVFVVYSGGAWDGAYSPIRILAETNGSSWILDRDDHEPNVPARVLAVARRYFDAHPEPQPWHGAEPGEVFLVTWPGSEREEAVVVPGAWPKAWECVTSARRIWPEVSS